MVKNKKIIPTAGNDVEQLKFSYTTDESIWLHNYLNNSLAVLTKAEFTYTPCPAI